MQITITITIKLLPRFHTNFPDDVRLFLITHSLVFITFDQFVGTNLIRPNSLKLRLHYFSTNSYFLLIASQPTATEHRVMCPQECFFPHQTAPTGQE